jgi:hypothetical protein
MRPVLATLVTATALLFTACCCDDVETDGTDPVAVSIPEAAEEYPAAHRVKSATTCKSLGEHQEPGEAATEFAPEDVVYFSMTIKGRPKEGLATGKFFWRDGMIAEATADLADPNSGVIFSVGESTYAGFNLTHENPLPVSPKYHVEAFLDGEKVGDYPFAIVPPPGSPSPKLHEATLAHGSTDDYVAIRPAMTFAATDQIHIVGKVDFCLHCWLQVDWYVAGTLSEEGTRSFTASENSTNTGFAFAYIPDGGWPTGTSEAVLTMNDAEVGRYPFTVE